VSDIFEVTVKTFIEERINLQFVIVAVCVLIYSFQPSDYLIYLLSL